MKLKSAIRYLTNASDPGFGTAFSRPRYVSLVITKKCNLRCRHCDIWKNEDSGRELEDEKWLRALEDIKNWLGAQEIEINGGEPLLKKELVFKIIEKCNQLNLPVSLNTNGTMIDRDATQELLKWNLKSVKISLYSLNPLVHDELRGLAGTFEKTKQALDCLNELRQGKGKRVEIRMLLTRQNNKEIDEIISYASLKGLDLIFQPLDFNIDADYKNNWQTKSDLWPEKDQVIKYLKPLTEQRSKIIKNPPFYLKLIYQYYLDPDSFKKRQCLAPYNNLVVWPNGDVALCFRSNVLGNISNSSVREVWQGEKAGLERKRLQKCQKSCKIIGCNIKKQIKDFLL